LQVCICVGILFGYVACKFLNPHWDWMFFCGLPMAAVLLLCFLFITPYSPRWLMTKGRDKEARAVLMVG
jgi:SP family galactose:H+ symporter-like MFS transporter